MKVKSFLKRFPDACAPAVNWMRENSIDLMEDAWDRCERSDWMLWTLQVLKFNDKFLWVRMAIAFAERVLHIYEEKYESDAPRKAIEAAKAWIEHPTEENRMKCRRAADAADAYADAAYADVAAAAYAADAAAAADDAADAAYAAYAADAAVDAAVADDERKAQADIIRSLIKNPFIKKED